MVMGSMVPSTKQGVKMKVIRIRSLVTGSINSQQVRVTHHGRQWETELGVDYTMVNKNTFTYIGLELHDRERTRD